MIIENKFDKNAIKVDKNFKNYKFRHKAFILKRFPVGVIVSSLFCKFIIRSF